MTEFYQKAKEFAERVIAPRAAEIDEKDEFPVDVFEALAEEGFMKLIVPTEFGGLGKGYAEHADVVYALSEVSGTVGICYFQHNTTIFEVINVGTDKLKDEVFNGVVKDHKICALACSEIGTGCHFYSCETTAERLENGKTRINGVKSMVTMASYASWYCIDCQAVGTEGISQWLVPATADGIVYRTQDWHGVGMRGNISCPMEMNNIEIDEYYRYGNEGEGMQQILQVVAPPFILGLAALYGGIASGLFNEACAYSMARQYPAGTYQDGKKLCEIEPVQTHLGRLYANSLASKSIVENAAVAMDAGEPDAVLRIMGARAFTIDVVLDSAKYAMRIGGGKGYNKANAIERMMRDGYAGQIMAPGADVLGLWIGRLVTGQNPV